MKKIINQIKNLDKKNKIILSVILLIISILLGILVSLKLTKKSTAPKKEKIVLEMDNYVYKDGSLYFLNPKNEKIGKYKCNNKDEKICMVAFYNNEKNINDSKYLFESEEEVFLRSSIYNERFVFVRDSVEDEYILYDFIENDVVDTYSEIKKGDDESAIVKNKEGMYSLINLSEEKVKESLPFIYDSLKKQEKQKSFIYKYNGEYGIITKENNILASKISDEIYDYNNKYVVTSDGVNYYLLDYKGINVLEKEYDYINTSTNFVSLINNNLLYLRDNELDKINEDGIKLYTKNYNPLYYFDEKTNKLVKEEKAYVLKENLNEIEVVVETDNHKFNLYELALNKKHDFVNYINNKIFIYEDENKELLIGDYECDNENEITKSSKTYDNCYIALNDNFIKSDKPSFEGITPVINKKYVFIDDKKTLSVNKRIVLFDLEKSEKIVEYNGVHFDEVDNFILEDVNNYLIGAINTKKEIGVIQIINNKIKGCIPFKQKLVKYEKDYIIARSTADKYMLYDYDGERLIKSETENEILELKNKEYILTKDKENQYVIYSTSGEIVSKKFRHIVLSNKYYGAVDSNNSVFVYSYKEHEAPLIKLTDTIKKPYKDNLALFEEYQKIEVKLNNKSYLFNKYGETYE